MYCSACGSPVPANMSYCNRCGASQKEETSKSRTGAITAFLAGITITAIAGLGIMLGGTLTLRKEANLDPQLIGFFMLFTFIIILVTELFLARQLSRVISLEHKKPPALPREQILSQLPPARNVGEPLSSVTENTTRTLEYVNNEPR